VAPLEVKWTNHDSCILLCTHCGTGQPLHRDTYPFLPNPLPMTCGCGGLASLELELRREVRTPVLLAGILYEPETQEPFEHVTITGLSTHGVGFRCLSSDMQVGKLYTLSFVLDDEAMTWFEEDIIVRHVQADHIVEAEFVAPERDTFGLDVYLMTRPVLSHPAVSSPSRRPLEPLEELT
jgi:hypothetical protein